MRLISYQLSGSNDTKIHWGVLRPASNGASYVDGAELTGGRFQSVRQLLSEGDLTLLQRQLSNWTGACHELTAANLLPPVPDAAKILAVGLNYATHAAETCNRTASAPVFFSRFNDNLLGHEGNMTHPGVSEQFDYEGELAVVIGKPGRHIAAEKALLHVAGYACFNDGSVRDFQKVSITAGKSFPATAPFGPWLVTHDELPNAAALMLETRINGQTVQKASTAEMVHSIAELISYASRFTPLAAGDVIATGTPAGIGARQLPPRWLKVGDVVEVEIQGIGVLRNVIAPA